MTLDTTVYVLDQVDVKDLFTYCQSLLGSAAQLSYEKPRLIANEPAQGLPAWLMLNHGDGQPLRTPEQVAQHEEWCEDDCDGTHPGNRACWAEISFDTAYGYSDHRGYGCGDLHAEYVAKVGHWLDHKAIRWEWENEFTGEIHTGYDRLTDLGRGGKDATDWFRTTVLPAIEADLATKGADAS